MIQYNEPSARPVPAPQPQTTPPPESAPVYTQPVQPTAVTPSAKDAVFTPDIKVQNLLQSVFPELTNAVINIAIKKFALTNEFLDFYVKDEYKAVVEATQEQAATKQNEESEKPANSTQANNMDFSSW